MKELIKEITKGIFEAAVIGNVKSVDFKKSVCDVETLSSGDVLDVRLRALIDEHQKGSFLIPKVGSSVIISPIANDKTQYYVSMFSEVDEMAVNIEGNVLHINKDGFSLKNDREDLKDLLTSVCDEMLKIYAPKNVPGINELKTRIKNLLK
jgi:hypothetical protein